MTGEHTASATLRAAIEFALKHDDGLEWLGRWYADDEAAIDELQAWIDAQIPSPKRAKAA